MLRSSFVSDCCASAVPDEHNIVLPSRKAPLVVNTVDSFRMRSPSNDSHVTENDAAWRKRKHCCAAPLSLVEKVVRCCLQATFCCGRVQPNSAGHAGSAGRTPPHAAFT